MYSGETWVLLALEDVLEAITSTNSQKLSKITGAQPQKVVRVDGNKLHQEHWQFIVSPLVGHYL